MIMASDVLDRMLLDWETGDDACGVCEEKRVDGEGIIVYEWVYFSFIQHKGNEVVWRLEVKPFSKFDTWVNFNDPKLVYWRSFEMNWQQT